MLVLFRCYQYEGLDLFVFIGICDSVAAAFNLLTKLNSNSDVFIGSRDDYRGKEKYLIEEVPIHKSVK